MIESVTEVSVIYEGAYWVALIEDYKNGQYSVARTVIGASEPGGAELTLFFKNLDDSSLNYTVSTKYEGVLRKQVNFKRRIRESRKIQSENAFFNTYTKAHAMIKAQNAVQRNDQHIETRNIKEQQKIRKFELKQQKRKEKHKGH